MDNNQVAVYTFDQSTQVLTGVRYEDSTYELKSNETLVAPQDGLRPPYKWNGSDWDQASVDEFNAQHPSMGPAVTPSTQALNLLGQQFTTTTQNNDSLNEKLDELTSSVNILGQLIAKVTTPADSTVPAESTAPAEPVASEATADSTTPAEPAGTTETTENETTETGGN